MKNLNARAWLALAGLAAAMALLLFVPAGTVRYWQAWLYLSIYKENTFTSATIEVAADQKVISTGPYAIVRHPMYAGASLSLVATPPALGSYRGFLPLVGLLPFLIWRLLDEERFLALNLPGYTEYQKKVRHRLVPRIW